MMVVLVVFSVLALIFIFSSQHAMVKTRMSRVMSEQRMLSSAMGYYEADYRRIPTDRQGLDALINPVAYIARVPEDPFAQASGESQPYFYFGYISLVNHRATWMIVSIGPDGDADCEPALDELRGGLAGPSRNGPVTIMEPEEVLDFIVKHSYDPTNGMVSDGDVITFFGQ
jgi:hypothetical protein